MPYTSSVTSSHPLFMRLPASEAHGGLHGGESFTCEWNVIESWSDSVCLYSMPSFFVRPLNVAAAPVPSNDFFLLTLIPLIDFYDTNWTQCQNCTILLMRKIQHNFSTLTLN